MSEPSTVRVLVVDPSPLMQAGVRYFLQPFPDLQVVAEARELAGVWDLCAQLCPDVVLMDLGVPEPETFTSIRRLKHDFPDLVMIGLAECVDGLLARKALGAGVSGLLLKNLGAFDLVQAIREALLGRMIVPCVAPGALIEALAGQSRECEPLSERECEVFGLIVAGLSNSDIADRLCISRSTVKFHIGRIFEKLGVTSRARVIALAYQLGLVQRSAGAVQLA